jgi:hypothetical protein
MKDNIKGKKIWKLTAVNFSHRDRWGKIHWVFQCDCGKVKAIRLWAVLKGVSKSCGCYSRENFTKNVIRKHGLRYTKFYQVWTNMRSRCLNQKTRSYKDYGGRGIKIDWQSFDEFKTDMYDAYLAHVDSFGEKDTEIDRIDVNGNYSRKNCRWVTNTEQARNTRKSRIFTYKGERMWIGEWAEKLNIPYSVLRSRVDEGWPIERVFETPVKK